MTHRIVGLVLAFAVVAPSVARPDDEAVAGPEERGLSERRRYQPDAGDHAVRAALREHGILYSFDVGLFYQHVDPVLFGQSDFFSLNFQLSADWSLIGTPEHGTGGVGATLFGTVGLNFSEGSDLLALGTGTISGLNGAVYPDAFIIDELYWRQDFAGSRVIVRAGVVDLANWFDTNRFANDAYSQFFAGSLENNLAIPFPAFGGFGAMLEWRMSEDHTLLVGAADSASDATAPWSTARTDSIYGIAELRMGYELETLGRGTVRLTPWYATNQRSAGWGAALNIDQEIGHEDAGVFLRVGAGNPDVVLVQTFVSAGVAFENVALPRDRLGFGVSWADPAGDVGSDAETLFEVQYRIPLGDLVDLTPDFQVVLDPALNPLRSTTWVAGVRLAFHF